MALVLTRSEGEAILLEVDGREIRVEVGRVGGTSVRLAITAPDDVTIRRAEAAAQIAEPADLEAAWRTNFEAVRTDVADIHTRGTVVAKLREALRRTAQPEAEWFLEAVLVPMYVHTQPLAVRRLADPSQRTHSLLRLIRSMREHAEHFTRERYAALADIADAGDVERYFSRQAGHDAAHVPDSKFAELEARLLVAVEEVKRYVNQIVAHRQIDPNASLTWDELGESIKSLSVLMTEIGGILTASHYVPEPGISVNWRKPFRGDLFPIGRKN